MAVAGSRVIDVVLDETPKLLATVDGFKIESVSVTESDGEAWLFVGTDDEHYANCVKNGILFRIAKSIFRDNGYWSHFDEEIRMTQSGDHDRR